MELPDIRGQGQQPTVPGYDSEGMAERSYPASKVRGDGREEKPLVRGQGRRPRPRVVAGMSNPKPEARAETERSNPKSKEWWLRGRRRA